MGSKTDPKRLGGGGESYGAKRIAVSCNPHNTIYDWQPKFFDIALYLGRLYNTGRIMTASDWITMTGAIITIGGTMVTIWQAMSARKSSQTATHALISVRMSKVAEQLKSAQEHIREIAPSKTSQRGFKVGRLIDSIRREFDGALNNLPKKGLGSEARIQLATAQDRLNQYQSSLLTEPSQILWQELQIAVQDAISDLTSTANKIGETNE
jgi:hypothetical protein